MSDSFEFNAPDHFTTGAVGAPGQRTFYLQAREARQLVTLKVEKEQVRALAEYLAGLVARLPAAKAPEDLALLEPTEAAWAVGSIGVGHDQARDRILVEAAELLEEDSADEPASARFRITRGQARGFVTRAEELMRSGRPTCRICSQPMDPEGHVCPRQNGHATRKT
jgi:uncharacterized repeat protein (TIGR03847 family)